MALESLRPVLALAGSTVRFVEVAMEDSELGGSLRSRGERRRLEAKLREAELLVQVLSLLLSRIR